MQVGSPVLEKVMFWHGDQPTCLCCSGLRAAPSACSDGCKQGQPGAGAEHPRLWVG